MYIDENTKRNTFKDLIENIHYFHTIANPQSAVIHTETPRFATNYNLYDKAKCDFLTPFKYPNGKNVCIGDIIKVKTYSKDEFSDTFSKKGEKTFIVKFDSQCEINKGKDGCFLWNKYAEPMSYLNDEKHIKKDIEKICNIYEYKRDLEKNWKYTKELNIDENLSKTIQMRKTHSGKDADTFYDKNTILFYQRTIDPDKLETFKLYHNQIDEFIELCKKSNIIQSFINDPLGKDISKNISISLYDSGYYGGGMREKVSLNDFIALAMNKDINNQNELISHIEQQNTQNLPKTNAKPDSLESQMQEDTQFWQKFEKDLLSVSKDIQNYEKNKAVLIPEAKERIPKEILTKIDKLDKKFQRKNLYKSNEDTYRVKNTQALENISKFYQTHTNQSRVNTR